MYLIQETVRKDALARLNSSMADAQRIAESMLEIAREIGNLNLRTGKASADALSDTARKMIAANNPGEFLAVAASSVQPNLGAVQAYAEALGGITKRLFLSLPAFPTPLQSSQGEAPQVTNAVVTAAVPEQLLDAAVVEEPAASPAGTLADSRLNDSLVLQGVQNAAGVAQQIPAEAEVTSTAQPKPAEPEQAEAKPESIKVDENAVAQAALPAENVPQPSKIANKVVASPAVLKQGVAETKPRDAKKISRPALQAKSGSAKPSFPHPNRPKKSGA
jgi:hypothetical protein